MMLYGSRTIVEGGKERGFGEGMVDFGEGMVGVR